MPIIGPARRRHGYDVWRRMPDWQVERANVGTDYRK
jgi:hypothetical protein